MSQATHPAQESKSTHVHPFIAWTAVVNFALIFSLAPSVILAQGTTLDMSSGSNAVATRIQPSTFANHARMLAEASAPKEPNLNKYNSNNGNSCIRSCRITRNDCGRNASINGGVAEMHACYESYHTCVSKCQETKSDQKDNVSAAYKTYLTAVENARLAKLESVKSAEEDYKEAVAKAKAAYDAAKSGN